MRCAVIGGVTSTKILIERLHSNGFSDVMVWGFTPDDASMVSGWCDLRRCSETFNYSYESFSKVVDCKKSLEAFKPEILFVVGLSQIIPSDMLTIASFLNIGFHPTALPKGRGRAAIAWSILGYAPSAATLFELQEGVDSGDILSQEVFDIDESDDATSLMSKVLNAEKVAVDRLLVDIISNRVRKIPQDHNEASWLGRRTSDDGIIDWHVSSDELLKLIRASTKPHPGAYSFCDDSKIIIWTAVRFSKKEVGVPGRILEVNQDLSFVIQTGCGLLLIKQWEAENDWRPKVGVKLGYYLEYENYKLREKIRLLEDRLCALEKIVGMNRT